LLELAAGQCLGQCLGPLASAVMGRS
jgi:hypothetical protein